MSQELEKKTKDVASKVLARVQELSTTGGLTLPADYSPENAIKTAELILNEVKVNGKSLIEHCTSDSIAKSLLKMVVYGLSPLKNQCYFIPYANSLSCDISYQGKLLMAKRFGNVKDVRPFIVYKGDDFKYQVDIENGAYIITSHVPSLENQRNDNIEAGYAVIIYNDGSREIVIMTIQEIKQAWMQGATKGNSPAHKNFTQEMCKKTLISNACKKPINSSSDAILNLGGDEFDKTEDATFTVLDNHRSQIEEVKSIDIKAVMNADTDQQPNDEFKLDFEA